MFSDYTMLVMLYEMGEMSFRLNGASDFYVKTENEDLQLLFAKNFKFEIFTLSFCSLRQRNILKCVLHGHAALFFFIRPITLICGLVVAVVC